MEIKEIRELIKFVSQSGVAEVELAQGDFKLSIKNTVEQAPIYMSAPTATVMPPVHQAPAASPAITPAAPADAPAMSVPSENNNLITIKSPMIGTFYRSAAPDKPALVNVGDEITAGKVLCIVEAMKLFNEIESEISGKIVKVLVENAQPVEYDQPLFLVEPK